MTFLKQFPLGISLVALCFAPLAASGAGANADTIREAVERGVDTLITGEGPHWSAVDAEEKGLVIIYAGHYATETLGVRALAEHVSAKIGVPWTFVAAPTGL